jgi:hypothetical protein
MFKSSYYGAAPNEKYLIDSACSRAGGLDIISPESMIIDANNFRPDLKAGGGYEEKDPDCG